jgi:hypothetical protein
LLFVPAEELPPGEMAPPIYRDKDLQPFPQSCLGVGGAITFNLAVSQDGYMGEASVEQIARLAQYCPRS